MTYDVSLAAQAYIYGYPLVCGLEELKKFPQGKATVIQDDVAPYNRFGKARKLADPSVAFVSPNNDTLYIVAAVDGGRGPVVVHVPDTGGRYYVIQRTSTRGPTTSPISG